MNSLLCGVNIEKSFGEGDERRKVLDGVSAEIEGGEFVSIMGPSGSGKSTLLYALGGMDRIDGGTVIFDGQDLSKLSDDEISDVRRKKMGFVFQQPALLKNLNILDNILLPQMRDNRRDRGALVKKAVKLMRQAGIEEIADRGIAQVSGGQLQRAGICRALMSSPKIIFGDEPTGALNSKSAKEIMRLFAEINGEGTAILLVTHDAAIAARTNRVLFLCDGRLVSQLSFPRIPDFGSDNENKNRLDQITVRMRSLGI